MAGHSSGSRKSKHSRKSSRTKERVGEKERSTRHSRSSSRHRAVSERDERSPSPHHHRHHRRSATVPAQQPYVRQVRRSPSTIHSTRSHLGDIGKSIWDAFFEKRPPSKENRRHSHTYGSRPPEHRGSHSRSSRDGMHGNLEHIQDYLKHTHIGEGIRSHLEGMGTEDHGAYQTARDIVDELMDEHDISARQMVLTIIPELRYLLADEDHIHENREQQVKDGGEENRALFKDLKLCFVKLDGRDCRALVEYIIGKERDVDESDSSESGMESSSEKLRGMRTTPRDDPDAASRKNRPFLGSDPVREPAPPQPVVFDGPISKAPPQIGSPRLIPQGAR